MSFIILFYDCHQTVIKFLMTAVHDKLSCSSFTNHWHEKRRLWWSNDKWHQHQSPFHHHHQYCLCKQVIENIISDIIETSSHHDQIQSIVAVIVKEIDNENAPSSNFLDLNTLLLYHSLWRYLISFYNLIQDPNKNILYSKFIVISFPSALYVFEVSFSFNFT